MNCKNCGAPLKLVGDRNYLFCEYCLALYFPEASSPDGVVVLGEGEKDIKCPVCALRLVLGAIDDVQVLHCSRCRGILANQDAFLDIVNYRRARASGPPDRPRLLRQADLLRKLYCPICGQLMDTHPYYGPGNFVIDACICCRVVWLDYGEVGIVTNAPGWDRGRQQQ